MIDQLEVDNFQLLFKNNTPLMDVRAPVEYSRGSFPSSITVSYTHLTLPTNREV